MTQLAVCETYRRESPTRRAVDCVAVAFETELGWMALAHRDEVLAGIVFGRLSRRLATASLDRYLSRDGAAPLAVDYVELDEQPLSIRRVVERLERFAAGEAVDFGDVEIDDRHLTRFGRRVINACRRIRRGQTRSYGELAAACGSPGAARAVGQVMARNRYPLVVPCHRVLAAGGELGGYSAPPGLAMKRRLLALENAMGSPIRR